MSKLFIISSVAGGGKTTLINLLLKKYDHFYFSISYTTRPRRENEINGVHYFFVTQKEFKEKISKEEFLEWAYVHNHYYGTPRIEIQSMISKGKPVILDIDIQGAKIIKNKTLNAISIFIEPPNEAIWLDRLRKRNTDSIEQIQLRIENGRKEMLERNSFKYRIINENLETAFQDLNSILSKELNI